MALSLVSLLALQVKYIEQIVDMRKEHFNESVERSLYMTVMHVDETESKRELDEIDFKELDQTIKSQLHNNGIELLYHFKVLTSNGQMIYSCADYDPQGENQSYSAIIFKDKPINKKGVIKVHFPDLNNYIKSSLTFIVPALVFTVVLIISFIVTLIIVFRQKRLSELKNDFINNMTHEFKTPISTISLAAQMLNDKGLNKTPQMIERYSQTIMDETKRLRFQVEKVLQVSIYENQKASFKLKELDVNELIAGVVHTFALKVEKSGGKIISSLKASNPFVYADDMHLTNVIFNLMDNALKYKRDDIGLELNVSTWNEPGKLCVSLQENGIGIKKEDLKKIFEKFYRVHTGNRHDVKGFGLGLAYVNKIIRDHNGTIYAESEVGIGTKFIIKLPTIND